MMMINPLEVDPETDDLHHEDETLALDLDLHQIKEEVQTRDNLKRINKTLTLKSLDPKFSQNQSLQIKTVRNSTDNLLERRLRSK